MTTHHVGPCGFCMRQETLFRTFNTMEVQQTFYHPPQLKTVERWRQSAPAEFCFTLKAWQAITHLAGSPTYRRSKLATADRAICGHFRDTPMVRAAWQTTLGLARALRATVVVFQCPPTFAATPENVANLRWFFRWADRGGVLSAWELRHMSWTDELIRELSQELNLIHAVDPLERATVHGDPLYFRLHGIAKGNYRYEYRYEYTEAELNQLRTLCGQQDAYVMFNNSAMATDGQRFVEGEMI